MTYLKGILAAVFFASVITAWFVLMALLWEAIQQLERMINYGTGF